MKEEPLTYKTKTKTTPHVGRRGWTPLMTLYAVLVVLVVVIVAASLTGNPFGGYFAAYVSTALVIYGLIDLVRKLRSRLPLTRTLPILGGGLVTGVFINMGIVLGWSVYLAFLTGQVFTIGLVVWLMTTDKPSSESPLTVTDPRAKSEI